MPKTNRLRQKKAQSESVNKSRRLYHVLNSDPKENTCLPRHHPTSSRGKSSPESLIVLPPKHTGDRKHGLEPPRQLDLKWRRPKWKRPSLYKIGEKIRFKWIQDDLNTDKASIPEHATTVIFINPNKLEDD